MELSGGERTRGCFTARSDSHPRPPPQVATGSVMESLDQWLAAESRLKTAAQEFLESCSALHNVNFDDNQSSPTQDEVDRRIEQIHSHAVSFALTKQTILESQTILNTALRRFPSLASIQRLPAELLVTIFKHAIPPSCRWVQIIRPNTLLAISSVCRRWRRLSIQTASLWSHVDFCLTDYQDSPQQPSIEQLWLERAKSSPLHVHFYRMSDESKGRYTPRLVILPHMVADLLPYSNQIVTLRFIRFEAKHLIETLTQIRLAQGATNLITTLDHTGITSSYPYSSAPVDTRPTPAWLPALFKGLSKLSIRNLPLSQCPTLSELAAMLSNCPQLRSLNLSSLAVNKDASARTYPIIHLPHLRYLNLQGMYEQGEQKLLSILHPDSADLHLEIAVAADNAGALAAATQFMSNFRVTSLCLWHREYDDELDTPIAPYFEFSRAIHSLRIPLDMRSMSITIDSLIIINRKRNSVRRLPNLKILAFTGGRIYPDDLEALKRLATVYSLNQLLLAGCQLRVWNGFDAGADKRHQSKYNELIKWISQRIPEVIVTGNSGYGARLP